MGWAQALPRFAGLVNAGYATAEQLIAAAAKYERGKSQVSGEERKYIHQASTFLGPQKQTWKEYMDVKDGDGKIVPIRVQQKMGPW